VQEQKIKEILEQRQEFHGDFYSNFLVVGKIWGALLGIEAIEPYKVALMMDAFKTVRAFNNPEHEDNWLDKFGYTQHAQSASFYDRTKKRK
jgi:Domain of unknown function (DUF6378)